MSVSTELDRYIKWADKIGDSLDSDQLAILKQETNRISGFITSNGGVEVQKLSALRGKITEIEALLKITRESADDEKAVPIRARVQQQGLITADINQYSGRGHVDPSVCTSCAAAFLLEIQEEGAPLDAATIRRSIATGRDTHTRVSRALIDRGQNANLAFGDILDHGNLALRRISSKSGRPQSARDQINDYRRNLSTPLRTRGNFATAVLTKAPYSYAVAYRDGQYIFFDSHGEAETGNHAFIRTFVNENDFCRYLAAKFGFDAEFPDVDFDLETGQDNPNSYELTLVEPIRQQAAIARPEIRDMPVQLQDRGICSRTAKAVFAAVAILAALAVRLYLG